MAQSLSPAYRPRRPTETVIYRVLDEYLGAFIERVERQDRSVPGFVLDELQRYLTCGVLEFGLAVQRCSSCSFQRVVGLSCGGRGFCPSCLGRRMAETSAHLVDSILPDVPYRQFVITFPPPLRFLLAYDAEVCSHVLRLFLQEVFRWQRFTAKKELGLSNIRAVYCGAVSAIQRAGGSANLNLHIHSVVGDGVFVASKGDSIPRFHALPAPTQPELDQIAWVLYAKVRALLEKLGRDWELPTDESGVADSVDPFLVECAAAAMQGALLFGDHSGQRVLQVGPGAGLASPNPDDHVSSRRQRPPHGFDIHATRRVPKGDRKALERLCRYLFKPPISHDRLDLLDDGRVKLRFVRPWSNGITHQILSPLNFIARLVPLVPPPRAHQIRYHGFLAPGSSIRRLITPERAEAKGQQALFADKSSSSKPSATSTSTREKEEHRSHRRLPKLQRISWARLLKRAGGYDMETCPECGSVMKVVQCILAAEPLRAFLDSRGHQRRQGSPRTRPPARAPPQLTLEYDGKPADSSTREL